MAAARRPAVGPRTAGRGCRVRCAALALDGAAADGVRVLRGRALYEMGRLREAREALLVAQQEPTSQAAVAQWLRFLDTERARPRSGNPRVIPWQVYSRAVTELPRHSRAEGRRYATH